MCGASFTERVILRPGCGSRMRTDRKHHLSFETAQLVFDDPLAAHRQDWSSGEDRWHTIGMVGAVVILVAHTWPDSQAAGQDETGRIISARKATRPEGGPINKEASKQLAQQQMARVHANMR